MLLLKGGVWNDRFPRSGKASSGVEWAGGRRALCNSWTLSVRRRVGERKERLPLSREEAAGVSAGRRSATVGGGADGSAKTEAVPKRCESRLDCDAEPCDAEPCV